MLQRPDNDTMRLLILEGLERCTPRQREVFVRMYGPQKKDDFFYNVEQIAKHNMDSVVAKMPWHKLDTALDQIDRTLRKNGEVQQTGI